MLSEALNWALILKNWKQAFVLGLDPGVFVCPYELWGSLLFGDGGSFGGVISSGGSWVFV